MIKLLKKFKLLVIIPSIISLVFIIISIIPTNYDLTVPATLDDIDNSYDFEGIDTKDVNVSSVSVYSFYNISVLNYLQALVNPYKVLEKHNKYVNTSLEYAASSGTIQKKVALDNSLIAGYRAASVELNAKFKGYIVHSVFGLEESLIKLGDIITKCEGVELTDTLTISDVLAKKYGLYEKNGLYYVKIEAGKSYNFTVKRGNETIDLSVVAFNYETEDDVFPSLGFNFYEKYDVYSRGSEIEYKINEPDSFGPSAGLMQALFIYDALTGENLTKDLHIVGTGTIDCDGNAGSIGGVKAKIMAAILDKADVFFVPVEIDENGEIIKTEGSNYYDALKAYEELGKPESLAFVPVAKFSDAVEYLESLK